MLIGPQLFKLRPVRALELVHHRGGEVVEHRSHDLAVRGRQVAQRCLVGLVDGNDLARCFEHPLERRDRLVSELCCRLEDLQQQVVYARPSTVVSQGPDSIEDASTPVARLAGAATECCRRRKPELVA